MQMIELQSTSEEQTQAIAAALAKNVRGGGVIALEGELGAGKTVFVRGLARGLGIDPADVSSPTFVIRQEYVGETGAAVLVHIDAYRLGGSDELESIGWRDLLNDPDAIIAIEWPSRIGDALPKNRIDVKLTHAGPHARTLIIVGPEPIIEGVKHANIGNSPTAKRAKFRCRKCGSPVDETSPTFPFCSSRCKLADLGAWFNESYRVSRPAESDDEASD